MPLLLTHGDHQSILMQSLIILKEEQKLMLHCRYMKQLLLQIHQLLHLCKFKLVLDLKLN